MRRQENELGMPRISEQESQARRNEIIDACAALYATESYHDITMTQVASKVSFGRANVYNYFQSKEEILLALFQREYQYWAEDLRLIGQDSALTTDEQFACALGGTLEKRSHMLKLLAMNLYDMEHNSRLENLTEFKKAYAYAVQTLRDVLMRKKPTWDTNRIDRFLYCFLPFLHGVYPYAFHSEKQLAAMKNAHVEPLEASIQSLVSVCALKLLQEDE